MKNEEEVRRMVGRCRMAQDAEGPDSRLANVQLCPLQDGVCGYCNLPSVLAWVCEECELPCEASAAEDEQKQKGKAMSELRETGLLMKYFVLKPRGKDSYARASQMAMVMYADCIQNEDPKLAKDLREWVRRVREEVER